MASSANACSAVVLSLMFALTLAAAATSLAQDNKALYPRMALVEQYLMDRSAEIALARSAAPDSVSSTQKYWFSVVTLKLQSKAKTALYAWWNARGCFHSVTRSFAH